MSFGYRAIQESSGGGGSASSITSASDPTVDSSDNIGINTADNTLNFYDGTAERRLNPLRQFSFAVPTPTVDDDIALIEMPVAGTLTEITYLTKGGTNWVGQVQEFTSSGATGVDVHASDVTAVADTKNTQTSFSNAAFDAGDYLGIKTTSQSGDPTWILISGYYYENA